MRKILIIEDNMMNREILNGILSEEYDILEAENGAEGLEILKKNFKDLSVILLDLQMPVMDGFEFMDRVRQDALISSVPIIVMTADEKADTESRCMELGAVEFLEKPYNPTIMFGRIRNIIRMREAAAEIQSIEYDDITGLYTKQAFCHYAEKMLSEDPDEKYTVFVLDIKEFKVINNVYGEKTGDKIIKAIADELRKTTGKVNGIAGHYEADRFAGMIRSKDMPSAEEMEALLNEHTVIAGVEHIRLKMGMYENVDSSIPVSRMCDRAMSVLDLVKPSYESNVGSYNGPLAQKHRQEQQMEAEFFDALDKGEFKAWFQPKIDPSDDRIVGAEALVRWKREDGTFIAPFLFIPLFEKDGYVTHLDEYMFRQVCLFQKKWLDAGAELIPISVNMSRTALYRSDTAAVYKKIVEDTGIPIESVPIEITESSAFLGSQIGELMEGLKKEGFSLHMDDFGSGYSSLTSLGVLPFDVTKLDKSLTDTIGTSRGEMIIRHMMEVIHELGMKVVVEGVETENQVEVLKKMNCDAIQGYYYSRPVSQEDFEALVKNYNEKNK